MRKKERAVDRDNYKTERKMKTNSTGKTTLRLNWTILQISLVR